MTIEKMNEQRKSLGMSYEKLSEETKIPLSTIRKIFGGITKNPRLATMNRIEKVLFPDFFSRLVGKKQGMYTLADYDRLPGSINVELLDGVFYPKDDLYGDAEYLCEDGCFVYGTGAKKLEEEDPKQGHHTLEDYFALPEDRRVELIDGVFYDMAAPTPEHQTIALEMWKMLDRFVDEKGGTCVPLSAPVDVQLSEKEEGMVQPDVVVVCDREKFGDGKRVYGAPDLVVEVLSSSDTSKRVGQKRMRYAAAGVREYWEIDPANRIVTVYVFRPETKITQYTFDEEVPVEIWNNECKVDFRKIEKKLEALYGPGKG